MKMLKGTLVFLALVGVSLAALGMGTLEPIPKKFEGQKGCYIEELDAVIPFGESAPSKENCFEYRCGEEYVEYATCHSIDISPPCYLVEDKTKPYPECCKKVECPDKR